MQSRFTIVTPVIILNTFLKNFNDTILRDLKIVIYIIDQHYVYILINMLKDLVFGDSFKG